MLIHLCTIFTRILLLLLLGYILTTTYPVVTTSFLIQAEAAARREAQKIALATGRSPCDLDFSDLDDDSNNNDSGGGGGDGNGGHGGLISTSDMAAIAVLTGYTTTMHHLNIQYNTYYWQPLLLSFYIHVYYSP